jgi:hypothetical protein
MSFANSGYGQGENIKSLVGEWHGQLGRRLSNQLIVGYTSNDESRNNPIVAVISLGEGWHNNHHAFPTSARHGLRWYEFDISYVVIRALELVGLAWDVRRPSDNLWYLLRSSQAYTAVAWGVAGDLSAPADFDGDGATDLAVFRPSTGTWFIFATTRGIYTQGWGQQGDIPAAADYDGDGQSDIAVYRPSDGNWYILGTRFGIIVTNFGQNGDTPAPSVFNY